MSQRRGGRVRGEAEETPLSCGTWWAFVPSSCSSSTYVIYKVWVEYILQGLREDEEGRRSILWSKWGSGICILWYRTAIGEPIAADGNSKNVADTRFYGITWFPLDFVWRASAFLKKVSGPRNEILPEVVKKYFSKLSRRHLYRKFSS